MAGRSTTFDNYSSLWGPHLDSGSALGLNRCITLAPDRRCPHPRTPPKAVPLTRIDRPVRSHQAAVSSCEYSTRAANANRSRS
jgi:hypothetical protein